VADHPVFGHLLADLRVALGVRLGVLLHHLGQQAGCFGSLEVFGPYFSHDRPGHPDQLPKMGLAGVGILPVNFGL
jgi:hypothetical protein